jgi:DNA-binding NtrC family response regulator
MNTILSSSKEGSFVDLFESAENWHVIQKYHNAIQQKVPNRILLVDSSFIESEQFADALRNIGFACEVSHDGNQALMASRLEDFPLVVIRRGLPDVSGEDLVDLLKAHNLPNAEFIFFNDETAEKIAIQTQQVFSDHLLKAHNQEFYGEVLGSAVFEGISRLRRKDESTDHANDKTNRLHAVFQEEITRLSRNDSEIVRNEEAFKSYLADFLEREESGSPEKLLELSIRAIQELNDGIDVESA